MLLIQNKRVNWDTCQIGVPGATAKDKENRRIHSTPRTGGGDSQTSRHARTGRVPVDMRKGFDGLSAFVVHGLQCDPLSGDVYWFLTASSIASHP